MNKFPLKKINDCSSVTEKSGIPTRWFFSRILCFILALGIWIYVVNITTQDFEKTFNLIDIDIEGGEELEDYTNMSVVNLEESKVSITVKGLRSDISKLTENDFSAYIDVSKLEQSGKHSLAVSVNLPKTVSLVSTYPQKVTISVDENVERKIDVDIDVTEYSMDTIYEMGIPTADVDYVTVNGPSDVVNRIKSAKVYINLGTVMTSTVIRSEAVLVDKSGNPVDSTYLTIDNKSVTVTVPVTMQKNVNLIVSYSQSVSQDDYSLIHVTPNTIKVKGDPKILNELDSIAIFTLDGSEVFNEISFNTIELPSGIEVVDPPEAVMVIAEIEQTNTEDDEATNDVTPNDEGYPNKEN